MKGTSATVEGSDAVQVSNGIITIKTGGVYVFRGSWKDGQIVVDAMLTMVFSDVIWLP
ncbi:carbohydrate-binding domain-containing protein [Neobacillus jeddahensis]|uniref:carbohydrate-binding domain-containing protein n=1 Tax=Neobacillus jeddahensis TaxID=1461580 RepID=UPI0011555200|nr:carbohydrate-binding domain-containing protein [Neobacillus jeddahensis]